MRRWDASNRFLPCSLPSYVLPEELEQVVEVVVGAQPNGDTNVNPLDKWVSDGAAVEDAYVRFFNELSVPLGDVSAVGSA